MQQQLRLVDEHLQFSLRVQAAVLLRFHSESFAMWMRSYQQYFTLRLF
jgi:hypothetical protein